MDNGTIQDSCLEKVKPGEPIFVLRAQDRLAPIVVRLWADIAALHGAPVDRISEALNCAGLMEEWAGEKKFPD